MFVDISTITIALRQEGRVCRPRHRAIALRQGGHVDTKSRIRDPWK